MKKIIYFGTCIIVLSITVLSCKKHTETPNSTINQSEATKIDTPIQFHSDGEKLIFCVFK